MLVTMRKDDMLIFGGSSEPAALAQLYYAAGGVNWKQNLLMHAALKTHYMLLRLLQASGMISM